MQIKIKLDAKKNTILKYVYGVIHREKLSLYWVGNGPESKLINALMQLLFFEFQVLTDFGSGFSYKSILGPVARLLLPFLSQHTFMYVTYFCNSFAYLRQFSVDPNQLRWTINGIFQELFPDQIPG